MRSLAALLLAAALVAGATASTASAGSSAPAEVTTSEVCVPAKAPDGSPEVLSGRRWWSPNSAADAPAIVLVHGGAADHAMWDRPAERSLARKLVERGFNVFAVDWLGTNSPAGRPEGGGYFEDPTEVQGFVHQFVSAVRAGDARLGGCTGRSTGQKPGSLVLIGTSGGAVMGVSGYAGRYDDADAIVQSGWSNFGFSAKFLEVLTRASALSAIHGQDGVRLFWSREDCEAITVYRPGIEDHIVDEMCSLDSFVPIPFGHFASLPLVTSRNLAQIAQVGSTAPVLITWAEHEGPFNPEQKLAEEVFWRTTCGCDLTVWTQPNSGHTFLWHRTVDLWIDRVVDWLSARGISAVA